MVSWVLNRHKIWIQSLITSEIRKVESLKNKKWEDLIFTHWPNNDHVRKVIPLWFENLGHNNYKLTKSRKWETTRKDKLSMQNSLMEMKLYFVSNRYKIRNGKYWFEMKIKFYSLKTELRDRIFYLRQMPSQSPSLVSQFSINKSRNIFRDEI